ncbi:MAG: AEC family transporter [Rhodospirillales bacterium]
MQAIVDVAFPVFAIVASGWLTGRVGLLGEASSEALNRFVYYVALPPLFFLVTAKAPMTDILHWPFIIAYGGGAIVTFALAVAVARIAFPDRLASVSLHGLSSIFGNTGYMGIPLLLTAFGQPGMPPAIITAIINGSIVIGVATVLVELDIGRGGGKSLAAVARDAMLAALKSPLVLAPFAGIALSVAGIGLPAAIDNFCTLVGSAASPCALFAIGLFLVGKPIAGDVREAAWICVLKLLAQPALTYVLAFHALAMEPVWAKSAVILAALPVGTTLFVVAQKYGVYVRRATTAILLSTVLSVLTVSALLVALGVG